MEATTKLERYRYIRALGAGGMSTVVLAQDTLLDRRVALKRVQRTQDARSLVRLRREALIGASVSHPHLVSIFDVVTTDDGDQVIVMEYVEGETLREAIRRTGRLPVPDVLRILEGVAAALDAIHEQRIVHRDVKPANILLGLDGATKLADLGVASAPDHTKITTEGGLVGTFSYMAPEQLGGAPATRAVDIYALAAVAFEALSGRRARTEPNPLALAHAIATSPPPDLREVWPDATAAAADVLIRGMARSPSRRPSSARELTLRLRAALAPEQSTAAMAAPAPAPSRRPESRPPASAASVAAAGATAGAAVRASAPRDASSRPASAPEPRPPAPGPVRRPPGGPRRRHRLSALAVIPLLVVAAAIVAIATSGGSSPKPHAAVTSSGAASPTRTSKLAASSTSRAAPPTHTSTHAASSTRPAAPPGATGTAGATSAPRSTPTAPPPAPVAPVASAGPVDAVESFYELAATHRYAQAWALADQSFRNQLGGYESFQSTMAADRSITFESVHTVSQSVNFATVAVRTTSVRSGGTQHCGGTVALARSLGSSWLLHQIQISCA